MVQYRENIGYAGRFLLKLTPYPDTTFIVWGPLKGAFSSLVRTLTFIKKLGIIDNEFKLTNAATYLVFNGDVINGSETSLETLNLVLSLMHANPKNVFYIKGYAEDALHWQNDNLKKALREKAYTVSDESIPLGQAMTRFFDTLPLRRREAGPQLPGGFIATKAPNRLLLALSNITSHI